MKAGNFNIHSYLEKLNEEAEMAEKATEKVDSLGLIIPDTNTKTYNWLKSEYQKGKTEVKVEMNMGGSKFEPGFDMQGNKKTTDTFKSGMFDEIKTGDTEKNTADTNSKNIGDKKEVSTTDASTNKKAPSVVDASTNKKEPAKEPAKGTALNVNLKSKKSDKS